MVPGPDRTSLRDRIGFDAGATRLEDALEWAVHHGFRHVDFNADRLHRLDPWEAERVRALRETCARHGIHLGLHTLSGVNVAEFSACVSAGVDAYLRANVDHAHLVPEGVDGFLDAFGVERIGEVRLADNTGEYEVHLRPGEGTIDFAALFARLESSGYRHHYTLAFGGKADKLAARDLFAPRA